MITWLSSVNRFGLGHRAWRWPFLVLLFLLGGQLLALELLGSPGSSALARGGSFVDSSKTPGPTFPSVPTIGDPTRGLAPGTTVAVGPASVTGISVPPRTTASRSPSAAASPTVTAPSAPVAGGQPEAPVPAPGVYRYRLSGTETATVFGTRSYPPTMTLAVHAAPDVGPDAVALDYSFSPDHSERQVLSRTGAGLVARFEGGRIAFGLAEQTSQSDYDPPMPQVPASLEVGTRVSGSSSAVAPGGGPARVEDWTVTVAGREPVDIGGRIVDTVVVDVHRQSRPGSADQLTRDRRYWYDPTRALWVRWRERFRGARALGPLSFAYETDYTATLANLP